MKQLATLTILLLTMTVAAVPIDTGLTDSDSPVIVYNSAWTTETVSYAIGGTARSTTASDGSLEFDVYATGFTLFFLYDASGTDVEVCVDADCVTVQTNGGNSRGRVDFVDLGTGQKTVTVDVIAPMTGTNFYFDAVYVHPDEPTADGNAQGIMYDFNYGGSSYTGQYDLTLTSGDSAIVLMLAALLVISVANLVIGIWQQR